MSDNDSLKQINAIEVKQWLPCWDEIQWDDDLLQSKPEPKFYMFSIRASWLKSLTGVYRRQAKKGVARSQDQNVQRGHEQERSNKIRDFVRYGYPACDLSEQKRKANESSTLQKPGWLPTAIVINILKPESSRDGQRIKASDLVGLKNEETSSIWKIELPNSFKNEDWEPESIYPFEVIDGQHRLWAFEDFEEASDFELPVVAFHGLDRSWQAYLFWSINITPKRINKSLAFDLYPLLRREDWLDKFSGHRIYRETRCQELVEALWLHPDSPWYYKINMLGGSSSEGPVVSQAAWIRSLMASFIKAWSEHEDKIGGLFGAPARKDEPALPWNRAMQAAFLIYAGAMFRKEIKDSDTKWAKSLRGNAPDLFEGTELYEDKAFYGKGSLLSTDQGVRGFLYILNDLVCIEHENLNLKDWDGDVLIRKNIYINDEGSSLDAISGYIESLSEEKRLVAFIHELSESLATYDWRRASAPDLPDSVRSKRSAFKGSGGYKAIREDLLAHLSENGSTCISNAASKAIKLLGWSDDGE